MRAANRVLRMPSPARKYAGNGARAHCVAAMRA